MNPPPDERSRVQSELLVLRALCQGILTGPARVAAIQLLSDYAWREPVHDALFRCLTQIASDNPEFLRAQLPACLTRKGFPDVDWEGFFLPHSMTQRQFENLVLELKQS